jgi:hypothetical protein
MKKLTLIATLMLIVTSLKAQKVDTTITQQLKSSGIELQTYSKNYYRGVILSGCGALTMLSGHLIYVNSYKYPKIIGTSIVYNQQTNRNDTTHIYANKPLFGKNTGTALMIAGGMLSLVGAYYVIEAPIHIKKAGLILSTNSVTLTYKLN